MKRIVILISGRGSNMEAIVEACAAQAWPARVAAVISNRADAAGLDYAAARGIATAVVEHRAYADREGFDAALAQAIDAQAPDVVVLAGFMRVLGDAFVRRYRGRLINIHPSLLPRHPGLHTHRRALEAGDAEHGATVHFVTEQLDGGPAVIQGRLSVRTEDTADILSERVMTHIEVRIFPQAIAWMARGILRLEDGRVMLAGSRLDAPLQLADLEPGF